MIKLAVEVARERGVEWVHAGVERIYVGSTMRAGSVALRLG